MFYCLWKIYRLLFSVMFPGRCWGFAFSMRAFGMGLHADMCRCVGVSVFVCPRLHCIISENRQIFFIKYI